MTDDYPGLVEILTQAFETRFGGWIQPNEMDPCRAGLGGCPVQWTSGYELRELDVLWNRTPAGGVVQDAAMTTHHFLNLTGGEPDASWTTGDYTTVETAFDALWTSIKTGHMPELSLGGYRWRADGPAFRPFGTSLSPTLRNTARAVPGTASSQIELPPQLAMTVTEVTPAKYTAHDVEGSGDQLRNRWGRFYLPAGIAGNISAGRFASAYIGTVATAVQTAYNACVAGDLIPVMYSPTTGSAWSITEIRVDDICDVIRSRRYVTPLLRNPKTINQPA